MESAINLCHNTQDEGLLDIPQDLSVKSSRRLETAIDSSYTVEKPIFLCNDIIKSNKESSTSDCSNIEIKRETAVNLCYDTAIKKENIDSSRDHIVENESEIAINLCYNVDKRNTWHSEKIKTEPAFNICFDNKENDDFVHSSADSMEDSEETSVLCEDRTKGEGNIIASKEVSAVIVPTENKVGTLVYNNTVKDKEKIVLDLCEVKFENEGKHVQDIPKKMIEKLKIKRKKGVFKIEKDDAETECYNIGQYIKKEHEEHHEDIVDDIQKYLSVEIKEEPSDPVEHSTSPDTSLERRMKMNMPFNDEEDSDNDDNDDSNCDSEDEDDDDTDTQEQSNSPKMLEIKATTAEENLILLKEPTGVDPLITVEKKPGKKKAKKLKDVSQIRTAIECVMSHKLTVYAAAKYFGFSKSTLCRYISNFKNSGIVPGNQPRFPCEHCSKSFHSEHNLQSHMEVHAVDCKYQCDYCEKRFAAKNYLSMHLVKHMETPRYICESCGRCFRRKSDLNQHSLLHSGVKSHKCELCGKLFLRKSDLYTHSKIHTGVKNHKCDLCGKCFRRKGDLFSHSQVHGTVTNFQCGFCGKYFATNANLTKHAIIHSGIREHKCELCGKFFVRKFHLTTHLKSHIRRLKMSLCATGDENCVTPPFTFT